MGGDRQAKRTRHGSRALSVNGSIATRLILAPDVSIVQSVGVENPARWPGWVYLGYAANLLIQVSRLANGRM